MEDNIKAIANSQIILREEYDDWAILFDPDSGRVFGLNPVALLIWKMLDGKHTVSDIAKKIREKHTTVPDECEEHVRKFLRNLKDKDFAIYKDK
ncbi:MAG: SynChlorMet cassette protein ScmD [Candidatus Saganbacteria bacterium]|nr:SynChlorMet cassette protein ScmD [Candidatus Saganbacteria bacterium]